MARVLLAYSNFARFVRIDRDLLTERFQVEEYAQPGLVPRPFELLRKVRRADVLVVWFASWHALAPLLLARVLRRPSLLIVGGFDTAAMPELGYGYQQGGIRRRLARACMRLATRLMTNSDYSRGELLRNAGFEATVVHHGVPDPFGTLPEGPREPLAVTVSNVARIALERKGLRPFVDAAAPLPDVEWVLVGAWTDDAAELLRRRAAANVRLTGRLSDEELDDLLRRASVYVQASRHEGFGMGVAEAMLAGCVPVVTDAGALPEVVGDAGVVVAPDPPAIAGGVRRALASGPEDRAAARRRILERFPLEARRRGLLGLVDALLARQPVEVGEA
ncbi:MAG: glycosyltransferase family 4 protein [Pseudomonadota bacterium]